MKEKILEIFLKYRVDFSNSPMFTDFGIREEDFEEIANEIEKLLKIQI